MIIYQPFKVITEDDFLSSDENKPKYDTFKSPSIPPVTKY